MVKTLCYYVCFWKKKRIVFIYCNCLRSSVRPSVRQSRVLLQNRFVHISYIGQVPSSRVILTVGTYWSSYQTRITGYCKEAYLIVFTRSCICIYTEYIKNATLKYSRIFLFSTKHKITPDTFCRHDIISLVYKKQQLPNCIYNIYNYLTRRLNKQKVCHLPK